MVGILEKRQRLIAIRKVNEYAPKGLDLLRMNSNGDLVFDHEDSPAAEKLKAIVTRRIYSAKSTDFSTGTNVPDEQYAINIEGVYPIVVSADQVILYVSGDNGEVLSITEDTTDEKLYDENSKVLTVKSCNVGVNITRLNAIEL